MKLVIILLAFSCLSVQAKELKINQSKSSVGFSINKFKIEKVISGKFTNFSGEIDYTEEGIKNFKGEIKVLSINTEDEKRDKHLKSKDFFDGEQFPKMTFESSGPLIPGKNGYILNGKLTIKDVTKNVTWTVKSISEKEKSISFKIEEIIDRYQYNIKWNKRMDTKEEESWTDRIANAAKGLIGKYVIDKDVKIELELVADK